MLELYCALTLRRVQDVVERVCCIPADFHRRGDVSIVRLLAESGYDTASNAITVTVIQQHLENHPQMIDDWAAYSCDKRCEGWFFDSYFSVGHYSTVAGVTCQQTFSKRSLACAEFIKHELDLILERIS